MQVRGGSHDTVQAQATVSHIFHDRFDALMTLDAARFGGYREHSEQETMRLYGNAGLQLTDNIATRLFVTVLDLDMEIPGSLSAEEVDDDAEQLIPKAVSGNFQRDLEVYRLANKTSWTGEAGQRFDVGLSYESQDLFHPIVDKAFVDFDGPGPMPPTEVFGGLHIQRDREDINATLRYRYDGDAANHHRAQWWHSSGGRYEF